VKVTALAFIQRRANGAFSAGSVGRASAPVASLSRKNLQGLIKRLITELRYSGHTRYFSR
jgi:hypothetical protein